MTTISSTAATITIKYEPSAGIDEKLFYLPEDAFLPVVSPVTPPVYDLTGYTAAGSVMAVCGSIELFPLAPLITFIIETATGKRTDVEGVVTPYSIPNAGGIRLVIPAALLTAYPEAYYFINLIAPGGKVIPFVKGQLLVEDCVACC